MIRGLYTSAAGMVVQWQAYNITANNLANVNTTGFKKDVPTFAAFPELLLYRLNDGPATAGGGCSLSPFVGPLGTGVRVDEVVTSWGQGMMRETGRPLDFALEGEGFFVVETPQGRRYTRNGAFRADPAGWLVTSAGYRVLGRDGLPLSATAANLADQLMVVIFPSNAVLRKEGDSLFSSETPGQPLPGARVCQGVLEESNVNVVSAMVDMLAGLRAYEANQKALQVQDQTLDKVVNEVGRVG